MCVRGRGRTLAPMSTEQSAESSWRIMSEMSTMPATHVGPRGRGGGGGSGRGRGQCVGGALTLVIEVNALDGRERLGARSDGGLRNLHGVG